MTDHFDFQKVENILDVRFNDKSLLKTAFIHSSLKNEEHSISSDNERLEFLGDSILNFIVSEYLYNKYQTKDEGSLSLIRSKFVDANSCRLMIEHLKLEKHLLLGKGELIQFNRGKKSSLANLFEAIVGAIYLDQGLEPTRQFILKNLPKIQDVTDASINNAKSLLQEYSQGKCHILPEYSIEQSPKNPSIFIATVSINEVVYGTGSGSSKKEAEIHAAEEALKNIPQ